MPLRAAQPEFQQVLGQQLLTEETTQPMPAPRPVVTSQIARDVTQKNLNFLEERRQVLDAQQIQQDLQLRGTSDIKTSIKP